MLTLQFGQCGNQLGYELFTKITKDIQCPSPGMSFTDSYEYIETSSTKWFEGLSKNNKRLARTILIDTEKKVINKVISKNNVEWCFRSDNIVTSGSTGGSANNWSFGYAKKGPEFVDSILEVVRKELERADKLDTFLCLLSCAGGTGSGLGSYAIQTLKDTFPTKNIIGTLVFPFGFGEVATQNFNIILSLAKIVDNTDMIIVLENERLYRELQLSNNLKTSKSINEVNFPNDINDIACQKLLSIFQPANECVSEYSNYSNYIISKTVPHPAYKLATIEAVPLLSEYSGNLSKSSWSSQNNSEKWQSHFKLLKRRLCHSHADNYSKLHKIHVNASELTTNYSSNRSLSNILITRGSNGLKSKKNFHLPDNDDPLILHHQFNHDNLYAATNWLPLSQRFTYFHQKRNLLNNEKFASIITNNSRMNELLDSIINKAWITYTHGAFLHQYKIHGLEDDDFLRAFARVENLNNSYKNLYMEKI